jgi:hypothetical protein
VSPGSAIISSRRLVRLHAPSATPQPIVDRLESEIDGILGQPEIKQKLFAQGLDVRVSTGAEETRKWSTVIRDTGMKAE